MTLSNSAAMVPREDINGTINGVDFGPRVSVIARSPEAMLLWSGGHSWSVNGNQRYAESHCILIPDRGGRHFGMRYRQIGHYGGRLSATRIIASQADIVAAFGEKNWPAILDAVRTKKTVLIEGGGGEPQPSPRHGHQAYMDWRSRQHNNPTP